MPSYFDRKSLIQPFEPVVNGFRYTVSFSSSLASGGVANIQIKTNNKSCVILDYEIGTTAQPVTAVAIESPTVTDGTTPIVSYNMNRQSLKTADTTFFSNPTSISGGTTINTMAISAEKGSGGDMSTAHAWILKKNTSYIWQITNNGNNTTTVSGVIHFAEDILP